MNATTIGLPWDLFPGTTLSVPWSESYFLATADGGFEPALATSWEVDVENSEVRIKLREGIKFTDGTDYNAEVAAWNLNTQVDSGKLFYSFKGAEARSEYEVAILLEFFWNGFFPTMSTHCYSQVSMENYLKNGMEYAQANPVGTGPFKVTKTVSGMSATYDRNENYWESGKPYLDTIEYIYMTDVLTQEAAMLSTGSDAIDILTTTAGEQVQMLMSQAPVYRKTLPIGPVCFWPSSNNPDSPFAIKEVRQAVAYALDREALCDARGFGILKPADQLIPEGFKGHLANPPEYFDYDIDKAKELLTQAGYPNGFSTTIYGRGVDQDIVVAMQGMLDAVGIKAELQFPESGAWSDLRNKSGWEGLTTLQFRLLANPVDAFYLHYDIYNQFNVSCARPAEMESAYLAARLTEDIDQDLTALMQTVTLDTMGVIPIYNTYDSFIIRNTIHDTGHAIYDSGTVWTPANAWKEQ